MDLGSVFISFHSQLLKNKWYYVLHSTKLYLSFVSESDENGEKAKRRTGFPKSKISQTNRQLKKYSHEF